MWKIVLCLVHTNLILKCDLDVRFFLHAEFFQTTGCQTDQFESQRWRSPSLHFHSDLKRRVSILIDGSLIIAQVKPEDAGKYTCAPSNSLGRPPTASAYLTVQCECPALFFSHFDFTFVVCDKKSQSWFLFMPVCLGQSQGHLNVYVGPGHSFKEGD